MKLNVGILVIAMVFAACSSEEPLNSDMWLVTAGADTISVGEAARMWNSLPPSTRAILEGAENPSAEFVEILAGKLAMDRLVETSGILDDPSIVQQTGIWTRMESAMMARKLIREREAEVIGQEDIDFYGRNAGITLELSGDVPSLPVPFILTELPRDMAFALEDAMPGESVIVPGIGTVRVESVSTGDSRGRDEPDSAVVEIMGMGRERYLYLAAYSALVSDSGYFAAESFSNPEELPEDSLMLSLGSWRWTRKDLQEEVRFMGTRFPALELSDHWRDMLIENLLMQSHLQEVLKSDFPGIADSIAVEAEGYRRRLAGDSILARLLEGSVTVTRSDLEEEYSLMENQVLIPERRVFETVSAPEESLPYLQEAIAAGNLPSGFSPLESLASPEGDRGISQPLTRSQLPQTASGTLFEVFPEDTAAWVGPYEIESGVFAAFRLVNVIPAREATVDDLTATLTESAERRLANLAVENLIRGLRTEHGVTVNTGVTNNLPENPGLWPIRSI